MFDPLEVAQVTADRGGTGARSSARAISEGAVAAAIFRLLDCRRSFREIVELTEQPPEVVRDLYLEWRFGFNEPPGCEDRNRIDRDRDERELRSWEQRMLDLNRREVDYDLRARVARNGRTSAR